MYREFEEVADFQMIYIREAHPEDEWWTPSNRKEGIIYNQPKTSTERLEIARTFQKKFDLRMPLLVDPIDNPAAQAFSASPERIYVIDPSGKILYKGGMGPYDFHPQDVRTFLETNYHKGTREDPSDEGPELK